VVVAATPKSVLRLTESRCLEIAEQKMELMASWGTQRTQKEYSDGICEKTKNGKENKCGSASP
jgi:hypothetical protein